MLIALLNPSIGFGWLQTREGQLQADSYDMSLPAETETYYYHTDHLGTPKAMTDENQQIAWRADYIPFGMANITTGQVSNNLRFPGQYFDQETGLHYNYFRYYDPLLDRYITSDRIGLAGGLNTYIYANANPIRFTDPYGLVTFSVGAGGFGHVATLGGAAESGIMFDHGGTVCFYTRTCVTAGLGLAGGIGITGGLGTGRLCSGSYGSVGGFGAGGFGLGGGTSGETVFTDDGISSSTAGRGLIGPAGGAVGALIGCRYELFCTNESDECDDGDCSE